jgi:hypothetical protein
VKQEYRFFKRDVLKLAIAEINAVTDLDVELIEHRAGRFIADIQFRISKKQQATLPLGRAPQPVDLTQVARAHAAGLREEDAENLIHAHGNDAMSTALDALEKRAASDFPEPLRDPHRYLRALLVSTSAAAAKAAVNPTAATEARETQVAAAAVEGWTSEWVSRRRAGVIAEFEDLPGEQQADWTERLRAHLAERGVHPSIRRRLETHGWKHQLVLGEFIKFYKGPEWDKPGPQDLLSIAAEQSARSR